MVRRRAWFLLVPLALGHTTETAAQGRFLRGDTTGDGRLDVSDPIVTLRELVAGTREMPCLDAADADNNGELNLTDAVGVLGFLFVGTLPPFPPFPDCGLDPIADEDELDCGSHPACRAQGGALAFDGVDDFVEVPHHSSMFFPSGITIACWVFLQRGGNAAILHKWRASEEDINLNLRDGSLHFWVSTPQGGRLELTGSPLSTGVWVHVAGTYRTGEVARLWVDGVLEREQLAPGALMARSVAAPVRIGAIHRDSRQLQPILGTMDELVIYSRALERAEVVAVANNGPDLTDDDLVAFWSFDELEGQTAQDLSPNGSHGRLGSALRKDSEDPSWVEGLR